ncbi:hypothetical protein BSLA_02r3551 [Burkholderia stabilis]|nr:hypothetical protein BSLA_02r3551 [Burkholderia stabilis]
MLGPKGGLDGIAVEKKESGVCRHVGSGFPPQGESGMLKLCPDLDK